MNRPPVQAQRPASSNDSRGLRGNGVPGFTYPRLQMKLDWMRVPAKNSRSTPALSKRDMGPQSRPRARAARIRRSEEQTSDTPRTNAPLVRLLLLANNKEQYKT